MRKLFIIGSLAGLSASLPILYQSDPELFHGAVRTAVTPAPELVAARLETKEEPALTGRKVRVPADPRGHFEAEFKLNGRTVHALIDTGATLVAINRSTAKSIGLALPQSEFRYEVQTANGRTRAAAVIIADLQLGRIVVKDVQALVLEDAALASTLVGMSFLSRLARYQVEAGSMLLVQ